MHSGQNLENLNQINNEYKYLYLNKIFRYKTLFNNKINHKICIQTHSLELNLDHLENRFINVLL